MQVVKVVFIILEVLLVFNLLIFVHELGHFLAARWRKLKIERFAVWFGKPIWKKEVDGVEFALGWIPAGGYVSLPQMAPMEVIEGKNKEPVEELPPISPMDKIIVAFAGPLFSFLLAVLFAVVVWTVGKPEYGDSKTTTIGWVDQNGPAWNAGLRPGDTIVEIDGEPVTHFVGPDQDSITWRIVTSEGTNIAIKYLRGGEEHVAHATPHRRDTKWYERKAMRQVLIAPEMPAVVGEVATNSPAADAGLKQGDEIVAIEGDPIYSPWAVTTLLESATNDVMPSASFLIRRDGTEFEKRLTAEKPIQPEDAPPSFGFLNWQGDTNVTLVHPTPMVQVKKSAMQIFATLDTVLSSKSDVGFQQLGGPVMIIRVYKTLFEAEHGWRMVLWFSVLLNVNLAMLNLLPFPVLDGGHITLAVLEGVRRRPVSPRFLNYLQSACALVLIGFMFYIAFFDTGDWVRDARSNRSVPVVFAPE
jgi:regulator of sigma E protease